MQEITIADKTFERFISEKQIAQRVAELGQLISEDYKDKNPLFLVLLKGAYVFASDLVKHFLHPCSISFFRLSSYKGMASSGVLSFKDVFDEYKIENFSDFSKNINTNETNIAATLLKIQEKKHKKETHTQ